MFAYGATGAGKTHTMLGCGGDPGVMYRTMNELFRLMDEVKDEKVFEIAFSYLEVSFFVRPTDEMNQMISMLSY